MKSLLPVISIILVIFSSISLNNISGQEYSSGPLPLGRDTVSSALDLIEDNEATVPLDEHLKPDSIDRGISDSLLLPSDLSEIIGSGTKSSGGINGNNLYPLLFIIIALALGSFMRYWFRKSPVPYPISLLVIGLFLGAASRMGWFDTWHLGSLLLNLQWLDQSIGWAGKINPNLILFVFLPVFLFEAALATDVYTFRKSFTSILSLSLPGIIMSLLLTALIVMGLKTAGLGFGGWEWPVAFLFGTLVSVSDPLAVGTLMKEPGLRKKLGTLIQGESLLNASIAIIIFLVLLFSITGTGSESSPVVQFIWDAVGGVFVGLIIGWITISWMRKVTHDPVIEITMIIAVAYLTYIITEQLFHASGALCLVTLGLIMGSWGKSRISQDAGYFMDKFWELAAFIANTLVFIIAGIILAGQIHFKIFDLVMLLVIYAGIHLIRAIVIFLLYPLMRRTGYGINKKNAWVLWFSTLRGAVVLALVLIIAGEYSLPENIRNDFLFLITGLVLLTLLINASTIRYLLRALGLARIIPAREIMMQTAKNFLRQNTENSISHFKADRDFKHAHWDAVIDFLPEKVPARNETASQPGSTIAAFRIRVLEQERSSYQNRFREGMLGPKAVRQLSDAVNELIDEEGLLSLAERNDLRQEWKTPWIPGKLQTIPLIGKWSLGFFYDHLANSFDSVRGFIDAQDESLKLIESLRVEKNEGIGLNDNEDLSLIKEEINENKAYGLTFLTSFRNTYPEIFDALATRKAIRSVLNYEKRMVESLLDKGLIDNRESARFISSIEERMKKLIDLPAILELYKPVDLLREISWLNGLDEKIFKQVVNHFRNRVYAVDSVLVRENGPGNGMFIIVSGQVKVKLQDHVIDSFGPGSIIGEMAVLTGMPRTATVIAESPVTVLWISSRKMRTLIKSSKELENRLWKFACTRFAMNLLSARKPYNEWQQKEFRQWLAAGEIMYPDNHGNIALKDKVGILLTGQATSQVRKETFSAPTLLEPNDYVFSSNSRVFIREK